MPDGSAVLVDASSESAYAVNATAAVVWERCDGRHTRADIAAALLDRYAATPEQVHDSLAALLANLDALGVLEQP